MGISEDPKLRICITLDYDRAISRRAVQAGQTRLSSCRLFVSEGQVGMLKVRGHKEAHTTLVIIVENPVYHNDFQRSSWLAVIGSEPNLQKCDLEKI